MSEPSGAPTPSTVKGELRLRVDQPGATINPNIYGLFAEHLGRCVYDGIWVGDDSPIPNVRGIRQDVVAALRRLKVPVVRWPGGCFADEYHWKDGIGPREQRPRMINTHWGGVVENNHFGTHELMDFCQQIGAEPYVCGNLGSGTVQEMMQWVEYMTGDTDSPMVNLRRQNGRREPWRLRYFGVGNECWGCGGNMRAEYYADNYRRYQTFVKNYAGNTIRRIACGSTGTDFNWTEVLMKLAARYMDGLSLHWYAVPTNNWESKGSATVFGEDQWHSTLVQTLRMEELVTKHSAIMDEYDPEKRIGLIVDEWGTWYDVEPGSNPGFLFQQNTLRDALAATLNLNIFSRHSDRVAMANLAQLGNVLQSVIMTDGERMILTPTYHALEMHIVHRGATAIPVEVEAPAYDFAGTSIPTLHASASRDASGATHLSVANLNPNQPASVVVTPISGQVSGRVLTARAMNAHNTFGHPREVEPTPFRDFAQEQDSLSMILPAKSVVTLSAR